jgi:hypothetical protein
LLIRRWPEWDFLWDAEKAGRAYPQSVKKCNLEDGILIIPEFAEYARIGRRTLIRRSIINSLICIAMDSGGIKAGLQKLEVGLFGHVLARCADF